MKTKIFLGAIVILIAIQVNLSCKKQISSDSENNNNKPPISIAGSDQLITLPTDSVLLDASASTDPDGTISEWFWTKISGPTSFNINNRAIAKIVVKNLASGVYQFELKVTDNKGLFTKDTVQVIVDDPLQPNRPPVANAGVDQTINVPMNTITLDANGSTDPDNNITVYLWTYISGPGSFKIANANAQITQVSNLIQGFYQFELKVTDAAGLFSKDTTQIFVNEQLPCDNSNRPQVNAQLIPVGTLSEKRVGMATASAGNKILFAGASLASSGINGYGSSRVDIYDITTNTWSIAELSAARSDIATVASGNKIFFAGGRLGDGAFDQLFSTVDIYDVSSNTWSVASLSQPRAYIAAAAVGNKVFFAGGEYNWNYNTSNVVDIYDISTNIWSTAILSEARAYISAVTVNNKIYFAGGHKEDRWYADASRIIDIYDNSTGSWTTSSLHQTMGFLSGVAVGEKIYWAADCIMESKNINTWNSTIDHLFTMGSWFIDSGQNAVVKDGKIILFRHSGSSSNKFDIYDIATNTWSIGLLPVYLEGASVISVNNTIYVTGGYTNSNFSNKVWKLEF